MGSYSDAKYLRGQPFLYAFVPRNASRCWRSILRIRPVLAQGLCFIPKGGQSIGIMCDPWLRGAPNLLPAWRSEDQSSSVSSVTDLFNFSLGAWKIDTIFQLFDSVSVGLISQLPPLHKDRPNDVAWMPNLVG